MPRVLIPLLVDDSAPALGARLHGLDGQTMGTTWQVRWAGGESPSAPRVQAEVQQALDLVIAQMSTWLESSDLARYNGAEAGSWHVLPAEFTAVMQAALQLADGSDGAFNPAAGALVNLWGFGPAPRYTDPGFTSPDAPAVDAALARCGWRDLRLEPLPAGGARLLQPGGLRLDLSAIAKGYAVDLATQRLQALGLRHVLVEVGGELRGLGMRPGGQPWWVDLEPPAPDAALEPVRLALHGLAVATSGDYRRFYADPQGQRQSHTLDPRSGWPIAHGLASASVVHDSAMWADGWSTVLMVLGFEAGQALATRHGLAALLVRRRSPAEGGGFDEWMSPALRAMA